MVKKELDSRETGQRQTGVQKHDTVDTWMEEPCVCPSVSEE